MSISSEPVDSHSHTPAPLRIIRFGEFLVERGAIDRLQLLQALMVHHLHGGKLGQTIIRLGYCPRERLEALALEYHGTSGIEL